MRWAKQIDERPAVKRGRIVNKLTGDEREQLHERHDASDFELRTRGQERGSTRARAVQGRRDLAPVAVEEVGREAPSAAARRWRRASPASRAGRTTGCAGSSASRRGFSPDFTRWWT